MTNGMKGSQKFSVDGKEYTLWMSVNAYCSLEADDGMDMNALFNTLADVEKADFTLYRKLFFYGLQDCHPEITLREAGLIMTKLGLDTAMSLLVKAITDSMPGKVAGEAPSVKLVASQPS